MTTRIRALRADITTQEVDAIVNAANASLSGGGGVDGAIHRAAGPRLLAECLDLGGCRPGQSKITAGYDLPARYVIHAVGPVWYGGQRGEREVLASCYRSCLHLAEQYELRSIAFPAISCGAYRFPVDEAARIACAEIVAGVSQSSSPLELVLLACFDERVLHAITEALGGSELVVQPS